MAGAIWRKLRADIKTHKMQFLLVFGVLTLSAMLLTISLLLLGSADEPWECTFEDTNGPHVWVSSSQFDIDFSPITEDSAVTETTGAIFSSSITLGFSASAKIAPGVSVTAESSVMGEKSI